MMTHSQEGFRILFFLFLLAQQRAVVVVEVNEGERDGVRRCKQLAASGVGVLRMIFNHLMSVFMYLCTLKWCFDVCMTP